MMTPSKLLKIREKLLQIAEDSHAHVLDRVDAYLELAQLYWRDNHETERFVTLARETLKKA